MSQQIALRWRARVVVLAVPVLALCGCQQRAQNAVTQPVTAAPAAALPLATATPPPVNPAPPASALPLPVRSARYAPAEPRERYRYIEDAYAMGDAFGDAPPDYAVDYEGTRPWVWRSDSGAYRVVEQLPYGERDYYYEPGDDQPYFVSDPDYGYAYQDGVLVAAYDRRGSPLPDRIARERASDASRYLERARALHGAVLNQPRQSAYAANWRERAPDLQRQRQQWAEQSQQDADWRAWRQSHANDEQRRWGQERGQREAYTASLGPALAAAAVGISGRTRGEQKGPAAATNTAQTAPPAAQLATAAKPKATAAVNQSPASTNASEHRLAATTAPPAQMPSAAPTEATKSAVVEKRRARTQSAAVNKPVVAPAAKTEAPPALANAGSPAKSAASAGPAGIRARERRKPSPVTAQNQAGVVPATAAAERPKHRAATPPSAAAAPPESNASMAARGGHDQAATAERSRRRAAAPPPVAAASSESNASAPVEQGRERAAAIHAAPPRSPPERASGNQPPQGEGADQDRRKHRQRPDENGG